MWYTKLRIHRLINWNQIVADIPHKDLLESLGNTAAGFTKNLANQAANFACGLYKQYPWALTFGDTGNYSKGVWDELCSQRPAGLPSPPTLPFKGGQCPIPYLVEITTDEYDINGSLYGANIKYAIRVLGPVKSAGIRTLSNSSNPNQVGVFASGAVEESYDTKDNFQPYLSAPPYREFKNYRISNIQPLSGYQDNCGDLPIDYPQTPIPPASRSTTININAHGTTYNIPITLKPTTNKYNIDIEAGDISLSFDLVGLNINSNNQAIVNIEDNVLNLNQNVSNLTQIAVPFINNSVNFNASFNTGIFATKEDSGSSSPADEEQSSGIAYVTLDITRKPSNAKTQEGELAQDVLYAGWFQFCAEGYYFPREPIHFSKAIFKAPMGATDYAFTLYEGFEAKVVEFRI